MLCGLRYGRARKPRVSRAKLSLNTRCSDAATLSIRDAAIPLLPGATEKQQRSSLAYTGSSAVRCRPPPATLHRSCNRRTLPTAKTRRRSRIRSVWQGGPENKRGRRRSQRRRPRTCISALACNCNGAPPAHGHRRGRHHKQPHQGGSRRKEHRAPPRHTSTAHIERAAPSSLTGDDGLQLVEG